MERGRRAFDWFAFLMSMLLSFLLTPYSFLLSPLCRGIAATEVDGNRTHQASRGRRLNGFEDRGTHQASGHPQVIGGHPTGRGWWIQIGHPARGRSDRCSPVAQFAPTLVAWLIVSAQKSGLRGPGRLLYLARVLTGRHSIAGMGIDRGGVIGVARRKPCARFHMNRASACETQAATTFVE